MTENLNSQNVPGSGSQSAYQAAYSAQPSQPQPQPQQTAQPQPQQAAQPSTSQQVAQPVQPQGVPFTQQPTKAAHPKSSSGKTFLIAFAGAMVACVLALGSATAIGSMFAFNANTVQLGSAEVNTIEAADAEASLAEAVANKCLPSVASISVYASGQSSNGNPLYDYFNGGGTDSGAEQQSGLGSGVVLSKDGYVITNNHVIAGGSRYEATIEGETYEAELVGTDSSSDVAILKVKDATNLTPIAVADSDNIRIGQWVMSIGSPFGLEQSVATGIISATSRSQIMDSSSYGDTSGEVVIYPNLIQTDAAINPGNSGGALVNADGQLVGINTLITSYSGNYSGVGFAIPSNYAMGLAKDIISGKEPTHAQLGVNLSNVNASIADRYGFATDAGAYVSGVVEGGAAANAGIQKGDIIVGFDGQEVSSASDLMMDVRTKAPGDTVTIKVNRDGETKEFQVTLGSDEASQKAKAEQQKQLQEQQQRQQQNQGQGSNGFGNLEDFGIDPFDLFGGQ